MALPYWQYPFVSGIVIKHGIVDNSKGIHYVHVRDFVENIDITHEYSSVDYYSGKVDLSAATKPFIEKAKHRAKEWLMKNHWERPMSLFGVT